MEKLVRDKMPEFCQKNADKGSTPMNFRVASFEELPKLLLDKLTEEANEVRNSLGNKAQMIEELADLLDVVEGIKTRMGISDDEVTQVGYKKWLDRGGFYVGVVWDGNK